MARIRSELKTKLKKNDKVKVISGKDKGKEGNIISFVVKKNRVIVEGVNVVKKHQFKYLESGEKVRYCKKCGETL